MRIRHLLGTLNPFLRLRRVLSGYQTGSVKILIYHDIPENKLKQFYRQMTWVSQRYSFLDCEAFHAFLEGQLDLSEKHILITFDDGFASSRKAAEEVLIPLGVKALFFIPTGFINLAKNGNWREYMARNICLGCIKVEEVSDWQRPMTWDDVKWLRAHGHGIGSHSLNHRCLSVINDPEELEREIFDDRRYLEEVLGGNVIDFAYPFGDVASINRKSLALIGKYYRFCYSGVRGINNFNTPFLSIRREAVSLNDPPGYVGFMIEDGLGWYYRNKRKKLDKLAISCAPKNL
jgi:peptidoglycan/xylan/chitin deacetylase (PgdA/CDA1 family)